MSKPKIKDIIESSKGASDNVVILKILSNLEERIDVVEEEMEKESPLDSQVEKVAMRLTQKFLMLEKGNDGHTPTDTELSALIEPLIPRLTQPEDGHTPSNEEILALIKPLIPEIKDGETPTDERLLALIDTAMETRMAEMHPKMVAEMRAMLPEVETAEIVRDKLESLPDGEKLSIQAIQDLADILEELKKKRGNITGGGGINVGALSIHFIDDETPTGTVNGSNKVFTTNLTPATGSLKVYRGGTRQRVTEDYTLSGRTITFTIAPVVGEILLCDYRV